MKKSLSIAIAIIMLLCMGNIAAVAIEYTVDGDMAYEEGGEVYVQTASEYALEQQKLREARQLWKDIQMLRSGGINRLLDVPVFQQTEGYYCGPATVKQVDHYRWGYSLEQVDYAKALGTTAGEGTSMTRIQSYLANNTNNQYTYSAIGTRNNWETMITYSLNGNRPPVIDIDTYGVPSWPYKTHGHFVNISGAEFLDLGHSSNMVRITDPFGPGLGNRWYTAAAVYSANNAHFRQAIIW